MPDTRSKKSNTSSSLVVGAVSPLSQDVETSNMSEESRKIVAIITEKFDKAVMDILSRLDEKDIKIGKLEDKVFAMEKENSQLIKRLDGLESSLRQDVVVISGNSIIPVMPGEDTAGVVCDISRSRLHQELSPGEIATAYRIGNKPASQAPDRRSILVKFHQIVSREKIMSAARAIKPDKLYVNESLIPSRANLLYVLRQAKKKCPSRIASCGSRSGRVYVWLKPPNNIGTNQRAYVDDKEKLEKILADIGLENTDLFLLLRK